MSGRAFNSLTSGLLTKSRSGVAQVLHYHRSKKRQLSKETQDRRVNIRIDPNRWKTWRALKRIFQSVWFQLGGNGNHLNMRIVREIWRLHVGSCDDYFVKVLNNACRRNTDLANQFLNGPREKLEQPKKAIIAKLAEQMYGFFDSLMSDEIRYNPKLIKELSYQLGRKHAHFSTEPYTLTHWDTLNLAFMEELENTGLFDEIDLKAWQHLIAQVHDYMFVGYTEARELIQLNKTENWTNSTTTEQSTTNL